MSALVRRATSTAVRVRILPGAAEAMAALARLDGQGVVQSLLTGNIRPLAEVKLGPLGLTEHLDLDAGAYGTESEIRADLVPVARRNAAARFASRRFSMGQDDNSLASPS